MSAHNIPLTPNKLITISDQNRVQNPKIILEAAPRDISPNRRRCRSPSEEVASDEECIRAR